MDQQINTNRYRIQAGPDGIHWVSIEPLLADVREKIDWAHSQDLDFMVEQLIAVKTFLDALLVEAQWPGGKQ